MDWYSAFHEPGPSARRPINGVNDRRCYDQPAPESGVHVPLETPGSGELRTICTQESNARSLLPYCMILSLDWNEVRVVEVKLKRPRSFRGRHLAHKLKNVSDFIR